MHVLMNETRSAAPDGIHVVALAEGETYDLPAELALRYIDRGIAEDASLASDEADAERQAAEEAARAEAERQAAEEAARAEAEAKAAAPKKKSSTKKAPSPKPATKRSAGAKRKR